MTTENTTPSFVHLHLNTNYSFFHGLVEAKTAAQFCKEAGMTACACTDHGTLGGSMAFGRAMGNHGIQPIYGCEFQIGEWFDIFKHDMPECHRWMTLVCLAENPEGYRNLCHLAAKIAYNSNNGSCISKELLRKYHKGLIALSGGPRGEVSRKILDDCWHLPPENLLQRISQHCEEKKRIKAIDAVIAEYLDIFGEGHFFLEMQDHGLLEEKIINRELFSASKRNSVPLVATNDVHYLTKEQAHAHEILLRMGDYVNHHIELDGGPEYYMKTPEEMERLFAWCPEALQNTVAIAERCKVVIPTTETDNKPLFQLPADFQGSHDDYLRHVCKAGLRRRYGIDADAPSHTVEEERILDRMERELVFITSACLANEFLVIWDLLWDSSKDAWRWYNIGRGAVCGSLVAFLMPIHDVDPLKYNLLFECFLNEKRKPAWLIDEGVINGDIVFREAKKRYGIDKVARQMEMEYMDSQTIVKRVAEVLGHNDKYDRIADIVGQFWTARDAVLSSEELKEKVENNRSVREIVETAIALEHIVLRESNKHSTIILSDESLSDVCPVNLKFVCGANEGYIAYSNASQYGVMEIGAWKMDMFAENALCEYVKMHDGKIQTEDFPDNVPEAFQLLSMDDDRFYISYYDKTIPKSTMESLRNMTAYEYGELGHRLAEMPLRSIDDIVVCCSNLYSGYTRQNLEEYLRRKAGEIPVVYEMPELEPILKETYGMFLYKEQFMQFVQFISGLSLGEADCLLRAILLRKQKLPMLRDVFFEAARKRGYGDDYLNKVWDVLYKAATHCYPMKAHAVARALLLYRVACVKAMFPLDTK